MIGNKISNKITKTSRTSKAVESDTKLPKEGYIFPEKRQQIVDNLS